MGFLVPTHGLPVSASDVGPIRDFEDPLFEKTCRSQIDPEVKPPMPRALKKINWLHFPK